MEEAQIARSSNSQWELYRPRRTSDALLCRHNYDSDSPFGLVPGWSVVGLHRPDHLSRVLPILLPFSVRVGLYF